ncbi:MAG: CRISPR-associated endonuclease Cas2 [Desulfovibrio sp.]|jgi:CRISPR-associated protein Cas2|nr:CRISPR-associated endonuclease Cas2 [Desulfovibrio sp.]
MSTFVVGYDIRNPRRLQRVHRAMLKHAAPIEYSVFVLDGSTAAATRCMEEISRLIDPREDDLRCYPLPVRGVQFRLGKPTLPAGIVWTGLPSGCMMVI